MLCYIMILYVLSYPHVLYVVKPYHALLLYYVVWHWKLIYHVILCYTMLLCYIVFCCNTLQYIILGQTQFKCVIFRYSLLYLIICNTLHHITLHYITWYYIRIYHIILYHTVLDDVMRACVKDQRVGNYTILCCTIRYYAMLHNNHVIFCDTLRYVDMFKK